MKTPRPWPLIALTAAVGSSAYAVDTSQWKCETCPFEKGTQASVDVGAGVVSNESPRFGDYTGLDRRGGYFIAGGTARYRDDGGLFGNFAASDLGLDTRALAAEVGREGRFGVRFGYSEIPRRLGDGAMSPFLGIGGPVLTLPAGFPAASTATMPLAGTLQPVDIGYKRSRYDLRASWLGGEDWTHRLSLRHDVRDGTQRIGGSFFASASQLIAPLDQVTDQLELSTSYNGRRTQASLAYYASVFRNGSDSLTWSNPFTTGVIGSASGQMALAPDNQFHQVLASVGYAITPKVRTSVEVAVGRMTQDAAFVPATLNATLGVPALPAASLRGRVDTLNASARITGEATDRLRLTGSATHDERDNRTPSLAWPAVSTDMFLGVDPRINQPYGFTDDRIKLGGDYRGPGAIKASFGLEHDTRRRTLQETDATREATVWVRVSTAVRQNVSLALKLAHSERDNTDYRVVPAIDPAENPLLRKFNQAQRSRDLASLRSDIAIGENVNIGFTLDVTNDDYRHSLVGLTDGRSIDAGADLAIALSDETRLRLFAQGERIRSRQAGSQLFAQPDWFGRTHDAFDVLGFGVRHVAMKGKLELDGDLTIARSRSRVSVDTGASSPPFPTVATARDTLKLNATYRLRDDLSLTGSWWYERYDAQDWHLDGVLPDTVANLLALGQQPPRYHVNVFALVLRYRFK